MERQLKELNLSYEFIDAIFGKELSDDERARSVNSFRALMANGRQLSQGEIGCALSHDLIYRKMISEDIPCCVVMEDDVLIDSKFVQVLEEVESFSDTNKPQVVLFSSEGVSVKKDHGIERITSGMFTDCYFISQSAAGMILDANFPVVNVADRWGVWVKRKGIELYRAWPTTITQDYMQFGTDISANGGLPGKVPHILSPRLILWKCWRMLGLAVDYLLWKVRGK